jgi:hypothetical protein
LNIEAGGNFINNGPAAYNGNGSQINVFGFFRTASVDIQGGNNHQLNAFGDAKIIVEGDIDIGGTSDIRFNGNSEIDVGGDIRAVGAAIIRVSDDAKVFHCGDLDGNTEEEGNGVFLNQCRILPVDYTHFEVVQSPNRASTLLKWTTAKEENNDTLRLSALWRVFSSSKSSGRYRAWVGRMRQVRMFLRTVRCRLQGGDVYYRLRQVDFDGKYSLSKVLKVRVQGVNSTRGIWRVHPNPVAGESPKLSLVEATAYTDGPIQIRLIHVSSVMQKAELQGIDQLNETFPSLFAKMPNGLILLEISWGSQVEQIKIMKK